MYLSKTYRSEGKDIRQRIINALGDELSIRKASDRISCLFSDSTYTALKTMAHLEKVTSSTIGKGIIVAAKYDILDNKEESLAKEFEEFASLRL